MSTSGRWGPDLVTFGNVFYGRYYPDANTQSGTMGFATPPLPLAAPTSKFYYVESGEGMAKASVSAITRPVFKGTSIVNYDAYGGFPSPLATSTTVWAAPFTATCSWTLTKVAAACTP
jgi:hypothetical protein